LKAWNKEVFRILDLNIDKTVKELNDVEDLAAKRNVDSSIYKSKDLVKKFWEQI
jgi:hypothetical protein